MEVIQNLITGFSVFTNPINIFYSFFGVLAGVIIGALPGLGASLGIAVLLPLTYGMQPVTGISMLAGIYYGAMFGGSISAILINTPGTPSAVATTFDGYPMAKDGRAGQALGMAAFASVIGGTVCVILFTALAPVISGFALSFGPPEYFVLMLLGLTSIAGMTGSSPVKGFLSAFVGLFLASVGLDLVTGAQRFTFNIPQLFEGIDFIPVSMGLFGIAELIKENDSSDSIIITKDKMKLRNILPSKEDWKHSTPHVFRGTILGFIVGMLPGAGATVAAFLSYDLAKRTSKRKDEFGTGVIEGVAAPESANNAASIGAMVPMLTLGIPGSGSTAVMMGALMMFGMNAGPMLFVNNANFAWGLIASLYIGNLFLLLLSVGGLPIFVKILKVKDPILKSIITGFILIGSYALNNSMFTVGLTVFFGVVGYFMVKLHVPTAPMVLAIVLGRLTETSLRQSLIITNGNFLNVIFNRPLTTFIFIIAMFMAFGTPIKNLLTKVNKNKIAA